MTSVSPLAHELAWSQLMRLLEAKQWPQTLLLVGTDAVLWPFLTRKIAAFLCCSAVDAPCGVCQGCHLAEIDTHPDCCIISPEPNKRTIRIDKIRALPSFIEQTPTLANRRLVVLTDANRLNLAAANALLKMLEEPPSRVHFVLYTSEIGTMPATVLSRCQRLMIASTVSTNVSQGNYLSLGARYDDTLPKAALYAARMQWVDALSALALGKTSPCALAMLRGEVALVDLLWLFYLIAAEVLRFQYTREVHLKADIGSLAECTHPEQWFSLLRQMELLNKRLTQAGAMQETLALEALLCHFVEVQDATD